MKILIIRHGEPDYSIDSLTEKGWREAEILADRLEKADVRDFYVSPMGRARATAKPTLERLHREAEVLDWLHEFRGYAVDPFTGEQRCPWNLAPQYWTKQTDLYDPEAWRTHSIYAAGTVGRVYDETVAGVDALLARYGYVRDGKIYRYEESNSAMIALFCHFGLGMAMISHLIGVSLTALWQGFLMPTSSVTTFVSEERIPGEAYFRCIQLGDTSHLYAAHEPISSAGLLKAEP